MRYAVGIDERALRELSELPQDIRTRVRARIRSLAHDPRPANSQQLSGRLRGFRKLRVGSYRVAYLVDDDAAQVVVRAVGHRRNFYDVLLRRS